MFISSKDRLLVRDRRSSLTDQMIFAKARRAEVTYGAQLRKVARQIGEIIRYGGVVDDGEIDPASLPLIQRSLAAYAQAIGPWARFVATRMLAEVGRRDEKAWWSLAEQMGQSLRAELKTAPTGQLLKQLLNEQVGLITSLPTEAGLRVQHLAMEALSNSSRASQIAKEIMRSGDVTVGRANLIARTETGRAATGLTEVRARHLGSDGYIWRANRDADTRPSHRAMDGKFVRWDDPPTLDKLTGHAACLPNCRCFPHPIIKNMEL